MHCLGCTLSGVDGNLVYGKTLEIGEPDVGDKVRCNQAKRRRAQRSWKR